jgi:hypothetical protein
MASKIKLGPMTLAELRALIHTTTADLTALERAPVPVEEAEAQLVAAVSQLASGYTPDAVLRGFYQTPPPSLDVLGLALSDPQHDVRQFHAFLAHAFGDLLLARWRERLRGLYDGDPALRAAAVPTAGRPGRRAALNETLFALEVAEEKLIVEAELRGERIDRRPDSRPEVLFSPEVLAEPASPAA